MDVVNSNDVLSDVVLTSGIILIALVWVLIILVPVYVYHSIVWMTIAKKFGYQKAWLAWVPFGRSYMLLKLGEFPGALVFLYLLPIIGWIAMAVLLLISEWRIFEKRNYPGPLALIQLGSYASLLTSGFGFIFTIGYWVVIGIVAWSDRPATANSSGSSTSESH